MNEKIEYEQTDTADIEQIINLRLAYIHEDFGIIDADKEFKIKKQLEIYFKGHIGKDCIVFSAKEDTTIIAIVILLITEKPANPRFLSGKTGTVLNVYTIPEKRHKGTAGKLMEMLLEYAKAEKLDLIELKATKDGYNLYKKLGFEEEKNKYKEMKFVFKILCQEQNEN